MLRAFNSRNSDSQAHTIGKFSPREGDLILRNFVQRMYFANINIK